LIPKTLVKQIWTAIIQALNEYANFPFETSEALNQPITLDDLRVAIKRLPSSSLPGPSGLFYAKMIEWPKAVLVKAHEAVAAIWKDKIIPECWNKKWLCPKPKIDPEKATLQDLCPLNLLETPR